MLWIILHMLSIGSLAAFSASITRAIGGGQSVGGQAFGGLQPAGGMPQAGGARPAGGVQQARANADVAPKPEPFTPGLRLGPPPSRPGTPLPRGSLLDLSV